MGGGGAIITDITIVNTVIHSVSRITDHALVTGQICIEEVSTKFFRHIERLEGVITLEKCKYKI